MTRESDCFEGGSTGSGSQTRCNGHSRVSQSHNGTPRSERTRPVSSSTRPEYDPQSVPYYRQVVRSDRNNYTRLHHVMDHPALNSPVPERPRSGGHRPLLSSSHHQCGPNQSPYYSTETSYQSYSNSPNASQASQAQSILPHVSRQGRYQSQMNSFPYYVPGNGHSTPFHAIGSVREDGQVFDPDGTFEEYPPNEHYEQYPPAQYERHEQYEQGSQFEENASSEYYNIRSKGTY